VPVSGDEKPVTQRAGGPVYNAFGLMQLRCRTHAPEQLRHGCRVNPVSRRVWFRRYTLLQPGTSVPLPDASAGGFHQCATAKREFIDWLGPPDYLARL
jgi:hypothetical protein